MPVEFHCGQMVGYGSITDESRAGACIEEVNHQPLPGKRLRLLLSLDQAKGPLELPAEVVRFTAAGGFAVRFPEARRTRTEDAARDSRSGEGAFSGTGLGHTVEPRGELRL